MSEQPVTRTPVTYHSCDHVTGPFFHGTRSVLAPGAELVPGHGSNYQQGRVSRHLYFSALVETAVWGAELATALAADAGPGTDGREDGRGGAEPGGGSRASGERAGGGRGHVYVVEPLGPFEDDPNVTDKRFPGNPTQSYRTRDPLRVVAELEEWEGHAPEVLQSMLDGLARLRQEGLDVIED
ncbi:NAD(+)--rifampin ADP-ribosyltransferase [Cellulomonas sp. NS3]|uniref:NAD(+)--rifampin ADP-ribosyltransferase n=1 Tax=Cellulomonas sp. NS3 TaxID=2973977 RepID=UPI002163D80A|nr:NAD(+)--rifampin ADP-ribosyltransferase [Cellulomonas sp. NS3]